MPDSPLKFNSSNAANIDIKNKLHLIKIYMRKQIGNDVFLVHTSHDSKPLEHVSNDTRNNPYQTLKKKRQS